MDRFSLYIDISLVASNVIRADKASSMKRFSFNISSNLLDKTHLSRHKIGDHSDVVGACRRCSNYIFILDLTTISTFQ